MKNNTIDVKAVILDSLENIGIIVDNSEEDIDINSYGMDSFLYITFIVDLEEKLEIDFPDELLSYERFSSINGFTNLIKALLEESTK